MACLYVAVDKANRISSAFERGQDVFACQCSAVAEQRFVAVEAVDFGHGNEKAPEKGLYTFFGGAGGIRTRGGLLTHTRFPGVRLKPLIHRSEALHSSSEMGVFSGGVVRVVVV